jgi:hypothetical protein
VDVNNSIKVGRLVFLLQIFVIMENIMKRLVLLWTSNKGGLGLNAHRYGGGDDNCAQPSFSLEPEARQTYTPD